MAKLEPYKGGYYLWQYVPSIAAAVIFLLLFLGMTALVSWRMFKTRTWFCLPFALGGLCKLASAQHCGCGTNVSMQSNSPDTVPEPPHTIKPAA